MRFGPSFTPDVIKWLIGACLALHLVAMYAFPALYAWLALTPAAIWERFALWQLATSSLLAGSGFALLFEMLVLWMFGAELAARWGRTKFLQYMALCSVGGAVAMALAAGGLRLLGIDVGYVASFPTLSVAILALILAYSLTFSDRQVLLFFALPLRTLYFVPGLLFIQLVLGAPLLIWIGDLAAIAIGLAYCWRGGETRMSLQLVLHRYRRWRMRGKLRAIDNDELRRQQRRRNLH
jgi:membrane associated rhomboid family serine protease